MIAGVEDSRCWKSQSSPRYCRKCYNNTFLIRPSKDLERVVGWSEASVGPLCCVLAPDHQTRAKTWPTEEPESEQICEEEELSYWFAAFGPMDRRTNGWMDRLMDGRTRDCHIWYHATLSPMQTRAYTGPDCVLVTLRLKIIKGKCPFTLK